MSHRGNSRFMTFFFVREKKLMLCITSPFLPTFLPSIHPAFPWDLNCMMVWFPHKGRFIALMSLWFRYMKPYLGHQGVHSPLSIYVVIPFGAKRNGHVWGNKATLIIFLNLIFLSETFGISNKIRSNIQDKRCWMPRMQKTHSWGVSRVSHSSLWTLWLLCLKMFTKWKQTSVKGEFQVFIFPTLLRWWVE